MIYDKTADQRIHVVFLEISILCGKWMVEFKKKIRL